MRLARTIRSRAPAGSQIRLDGYTDTRDTTRVFQRMLSLRRAKNTLGFLRARLGGRYRYLVTGDGPADPLATNATAAGRARNRRVEVQYTAPSPGCNPGNPSHCGTNPPSCNPSPYRPCDTATCTRTPYNPCGAATLCNIGNPGHCDIVHFALDSARLGARQRDALTQLARTIGSEAPAGSTIRLYGYTDNRDTAVAYQRLMSLHRAENTRTVLRAALGHRYRYIVAGHGPSDPLATNATAAGRARNRRVEIHYTSNCTPKYPNPC